MNIVPPTSQHHHYLLLLNPNQVYSFKWTEFPILEYLEKLYATPPPPLIFMNVLPFSKGKSRDMIDIIFRATKVPMKYKIPSMETIMVQYLIHAMPHNGEIEKERIEQSRSVCTTRDR